MLAENPVRPMGALLGDANRSGIRQVDRGMDWCATGWEMIARRKRQEGGGGAGRNKPAGRVDVLANVCLGDRDGYAACLR